MLPCYRISVYTGAEGNTAAKGNGGAEAEGDAVAEGDSGTEGDAKGEVRAAAYTLPLSLAFRAPKERSVNLEEIVCIL